MGESLGKCGEEPGVFGGAADGDANGFRKTHPAHGTNDDSFKQELVAEGFCVRADRDEQEIGFARDRREAEASEFEDKAAPFDAIHFDRAADVVDVIESGKCCGLAHAGDVEGSAELVHFSDKSWMADAVADAESGEPVNFGEGVEGQDVVVLFEELRGVGKIGALGVFEIGFVENHEDIAGNLLKKGGKFSGAKGGAGGVVGIGDINYTGLRRDRGGDGVQIEREILHARLDEFAATGADGDGEECEGSFAGDALEAGTQEDAGGQIDDFAGTEANENFFGFHGVAGGKNFTETFAAAVGIPVGFAKSAAGGFHGTGGRAERVFVGG